MQLGNILSTATEPVVCKSVKFRVLGEDQQGRQTSGQAEAVFAFVNEDRREEYKRLAREWLEQGDFKGKEIPIDVLTEEEYRWFLMAALRDKDAPQKQFCPNGEYEKFRKALILRQVTRLLAGYNDFVEAEYPELLTDDKQADLREQAEGE